MLGAQPRDTRRADGRGGAAKGGPGAHGGVWARQQGREAGAARGGGTALLPARPIERWSVHGPYY